MFRNLSLEYCNLEFGSLGIRVWDSVLLFVIWCLGFGMLEFWILILMLWVWQFEFGSLGLNFCSLGVWVWDSVMRFVV